jgi:hypothetical protein
MGFTATNLVPSADDAMPLTSVQITLEVVQVAPEFVEASIEPSAAAARLIPSAEEAIRSAVCRLLVAQVAPASVEA